MKCSYIPFTGTQNPEKRFILNFVALNICALSVAVFVRSMQADDAPSAQVQACLVLYTMKYYAIFLMQSVRLQLQVASLQIGDEVPNFSCESHMGVVNLHDYIDGGWGVILTFPKTEDPVACSQLG
jgi:poly-beta-hydroxyalkanoate depolymerase